jgi:hypothetical protein
MPSRKKFGRQRRSGHFFGQPCSIISVPLRSRGGGARLKACTIAGFFPSLGSMIFSDCTSPFAARAQEAEQLTAWLRGARRSRPRYAGTGCTLKPVSLRCRAEPIAHVILHKQQTGDRLARPRPAFRAWRDHAHPRGSPARRRCPGHLAAASADKHRSSEPQRTPLRPRDGPS